MEQPPLFAKFDQIEKQKAQLLSTLTAWSLERLDYRPDAAQWSALEMLDHIVKTEVEILAAVNLGINQPHRIGVTDKLRTRFLDGVFRSDRRVKVPASASQILPGMSLQLAAIITAWGESRRALRRFLETSLPEGLEQGVFKHPVGGWMGMLQVLDFFSVHLIHHGYQLARLQASAAGQDGRV